MYDSVGSGKPRRVVLENHWLPYYDEHPHASHFGNLGTFQPELAGIKSAVGNIRELAHSCAFDLHFSQRNTGG
jgi:hypothetical protein